MFEVSPGVRGRLSHNAVSCQRGSLLRVRDPTGFPSRNPGRGEPVRMSTDRRQPIVGKVLAALFLFFLSACAASPKAPPQFPAPVRGPGDIPIPVGFEKIEKDSVLITIGEFEAGLVVYQGEREPSWIVDFYREVLPEEGWKLVASFISNDSILVFTKNRQACVISVSGDPSSSRLEVRIGIVETPNGSPSPSPRTPRSY